MDTLEITRPDDWHLHLRDGDALKTTVPHSARQFARGIVMPNLVPPVTTTDQACHYRDRILTHVPSDTDFEPLMTLYLTDNTPAKEILRARDSGFVHAVKLYPAGATTNSDAGVTDIKKTWSALEALSDCGMPLLVHGEVTRSEIDIFDRERVFIEEQLAPLIEKMPQLKIVMEHITTCEAAEFIKNAPDNVAATITAHHLLLNRNAMLAGGIRPHHYCLPVLKRERHREALIEAATGGNPKFFAGTDSAPHQRSKKEAACGCAGLYTAHAAIEFYAMAFEQAGKLDKLDSFTGHFGADFYGLPRNRENVTLHRSSWPVPESYDFTGERLVPFMAGETLHWKCTTDHFRPAGQ